MSKIKVKVSKIKGQGVDIQRVIGLLREMMAELEALGGKVSIYVEGTELETLVKAGNETRTRDILLGNNSVMVFPQTDSTPESEEVTE